MRSLVECGIELGKEIREQTMIISLGRNGLRETLAYQNIEHQF